MKVNAKIGVQMMMLKDKVAELGIAEVIRRVAELGYSAVEVSQIPMTPENVAMLAEASRAHGVEVAAYSSSLDPMMPGMDAETLTKDFDKIVADCKALDCRYIRIGMIPLQMIGNKEAFVEFAQRADAMAMKLEEHGIKLYYHTHHVEFQKLDGKHGLDHINENSEKLGYEIDLHWAQRAGMDPLKVLEKYCGRVEIIHLKDYRVGQVNLDSLKGGDMGAFFAAFIGNIEFAELGEGNLDIAAMIEAGLANGVRHFFVEQDDTYGRDPFESLKISKDHLVQLGYGNLL